MNKSRVFGKRVDDASNIFRVDCLIKGNFCINVHSHLSGLWVTITLGSHEKIEATSNHPIWVKAGHNLNERPTPAHLDVTLDEGKALEGRWVNSQDVLQGDLLETMSGQEAVVESVNTSPRHECRVCNLTVKDYHTFLMGAAQILAHNESWCEATIRLFPERFKEIPAALKRELDVAIKSGKEWDESAIHGHHLVMRTDPLADPARKILKDYDVLLFKEQSHLTQLKAAIESGEEATIDGITRVWTIDDLGNMSLAINYGHKGIHGKPYADFVNKALQDIVDNGRNLRLTPEEIRTEILKKLNKWGDDLAEGKYFWQQ